MFKYISKILEQFTISQKIVALFMLLLSIITIIIAPSLISSIILNRDELNSEIENQNIKIKELKSDIDSLEYKIRKNEKECTNQILLREEEFLQMLDQLKDDIKINNKNTEERIVRINTIQTEKNMYPVNDTTVSMIFIQEPINEEKLIVYKKPQINSIISMIDDMKKKIRKN
jgi:hypothetical protein